MSWSGTARCLAALSLAVLCLWAMVRAAQFGWADYQSIEARALLKRWKENPVVFDQLAWNRAREGFVTALKWNPENPVYQEGFADLYMVRLARVRTDSGLQKPFLELVLTHYLKAASLRPTWPYAHASIASVKLLLGQRDADFRRAILLASRYGPWEYPVHERLILVGYHAWPDLREPEREAIRGNLVRAMQYRPKETGALLQSLKSVLPPCVELAMDILGACRAAVPPTSSKAQL